MDEPFLVADSGGQKKDPALKPEPVGARSATNLAQDIIPRESGVRHTGRGCRLSRAGNAIEAVWAHRARRIGGLPRSVKRAGAIRTPSQRRGGVGGGVEPVALAGWAGETQGHNAVGDNNAGKPRRLRAGTLDQNEHR